MKKVKIMVVGENDDNERLVMPSTETEPEEFNGDPLSSALWFYVLLVLVIAGIAFGVSLL